MKVSDVVRTNPEWSCEACTRNVDMTFTFEDHTYCYRCHRMHMMARGWFNGEQSYQG